MSKRQSGVTESLARLLMKEITARERETIYAIFRRAARRILKRAK